MQKDKSKFKILIIPAIFFGIFCFAKSSFAATYYVDFSGGNDSNSGLSTGSPWAHAPGDTNGPTRTIAAGGSIIFKGGVVYHGTITVSSANYSNGVAGNLITLKSGDLLATPWGSGRTVIEGDNARALGIHLWGRSYIRVEGFEIRNMANLTNSSGILIDGNIAHNEEIVDNLIHDINGAPGPSGYGIEITGDEVQAYDLVEKNTVYHTEEKAIEAYNQGYSIFRYNNLYETSDHNMVISSPDNEIYDNLFSKAGFDWGNGEAFQPSFCFKFDSGLTVFADDNKFYNNLLWNCISGIGVLNGDGNEIYQNTVYYSGWLDPSNGGVSGSNFVLIDDGSAGTNKPDLNIISNNIFYYGIQFSGSMCNGSPCYQGIAFNSGIGNNNIIENNIIYWNAAHTSSLFYYKSTVSEWHDLAWFEGLSGFSSVGTGNIARNNIIADPMLKGGTGSALINSSEIPTGFDNNIRPNGNAFALTSSSTNVIDKGLALQPPYNTDIEGNSRPQGAGSDIGAYEYVGTPPPDTTPPSAPTGIQVN
ncbi:MAG: choice-of-anchor Q domain-containing protein [Minisyncoccia bacterium]